MRGSAESQARMIDFHAKSVFIIGSYVITRETVWQAKLNLLIRCSSTLHIIIKDWFLMFSGEIPNKELPDLKFVWMSESNLQALVIQKVDSARN